MLQLNQGPCNIGLKEMSCWVPIVVFSFGIWSPCLPACLPFYSLERALPPPFLLCKILFYSTTECVTFFTHMELNEDNRVGTLSPFNSETFSVRSYSSMDPIRVSHFHFDLPNHIQCTNSDVPFITLPSFLSFFLLDSSFILYKIF